MLGVSWPTLDAWIKGESVPDLVNVRRLARFMAWTVDRLADHFLADRFEDARIADILGPDAPSGLPEAIGAEDVRRLARAAARARRAAEKKAKRQAGNERR